MVNTLYIDSDGILTDFRGQCEKYKCIDGTKVNWDVIHQNGSKWWEEIEWLPEGKEFLEWVKKLCNEENIDLYILTAVQSTDGKIGRMNWLKKNVGLDKHHLLIVNKGAEKAYYADQTAVLVDDYKKNCEAFIEGGGPAVKYDAPQQAKESLLELIGKY